LDGNFDEEKLFVLNNDFKICLEKSQKTRNLVITCVSLKKCSFLIDFFSHTFAENCPPLELLLWEPGTHQDADQTGLKHRYPRHGGENAASLGCE
jgi:hypothetical protein